MIAIGYDMYVVNEQGERVDCPNRYWRRNISGGGAQARLFVELGLGSWADEEQFHAAEASAWPDLPDTVTYDEDLSRYVGEGVEEWLTATYARLRDRRGAGPGISVYKLCNSNDGWWVTKEECEEFLRLWEEKGRPIVDDFGSGPYHDTVPFIQTAAEHAGFRVY